MGIYHPLNDVIIAERDGIQVVANGNLAVSVGEAEFEGTVDADSQLDDFRARVGLQGAMTMEIAVEGSGALDEVHDLSTIPLPPLNFAGEVTVTPYVQVRLLLQGTAEAAARVSVVAPFRAGAAFSGKGRRRADLSSDPQFAAEVGTPDVSGNFDGTVQLEVTTTFLVAIQGVEVGGPVVGTRFGPRVQIDLADLTWSIDGLATIFGGWAFLDPTTGLPAVPKELAKRDLPTWHIAGGTLPDLLPSTRWSRVFDVQNDDNAAVALLAGDDVVVVESGDEPWLASLDLEQTGVPRWQSTATAGWIPKAMTRAQGGDLLVAGVSSNGHDMRVERYSPSGTPRWKNTLTVSGADVTLSAILATTADDTIITGDVEYDDGTHRLIVAALDALGNLEWSKEIETGAGSSNAAIEALVETPSGGILAVGKVDHSDGGATVDGTNALVLRLDAQGNPGTARAVGGTHRQIAHNVAMFADGSYAIGGEQDVFAPHIAWIASLSADDSLRWSAAYQTRRYMDGNGEQASVTSLAPLNNHGLLVSGHIGSADVDAFVFRMSDSGMPIWSKTYRSVDDDKLSTVLALPNGLVAFGSTGITEAVSSYTDLWMIRADVDGQIPFAADSGLVVENGSMQWQPVFDHGVFSLAPTIATTSTLQGAPVALSVNPASVVGELLTN